MDTTEVLKSSNCEIHIYMVGHMGRQIVPWGSHTSLFITCQITTMAVSYDSPPPPRDACSECIIWQLSKYRGSQCLTTVTDNKQLM